MTSFSGSVFSRSSVAAMGLALTLGACSNTGYDYDSIFAEGDQLASQVNALPPTGADMPTTGTGTYRGYVEVTYDVSDTASQDAVGQAAIAADFANSEIAGEFSNWVNADDRIVGGQLDMTNGSIIGDQFFADVTGTLGDPDGNVAIDAVTNGQFRGPDADGLSGSISGTSDYGSGTGAMDGSLVAERTN